MYEPWLLLPLTWRAVAETSHHLWCPLEVSLHVLPSQAPHHHTHSLQRRGERELPHDPQLISVLQDRDFIRGSWFPTNSSERRKEEMGFTAYLPAAHRAPTRDRGGKSEFSFHNFILHRIIPVWVLCATPTFWYVQNKCRSNCTPLKGNNPL